MNPIQHKPTQRPQSITHKIITSNNRPQPKHFRPIVQVIPHPIPIAQIPPVSRSILAPLKPIRLLIENKKIPMRRTTRRRRGADIIRHEGLVRAKLDEGPILVLGGGGWLVLGLETRLDPVEDGA